MASLIDRSDLDFLLNRWLKVDELLTRPAFAMHDLAEVSAYLDLAEELAGDQFLTHYELADQVEPRLTEEGVEVLPQIRQALEQFAEAGFLSAPFPETYGGLQFPAGPRQITPPSYPSKRQRHQAQACHPNASGEQSASDSSEQVPCHRFRPGSSSQADDTGGSRPC